MLKAANAATCSCVAPVSPLLGLGTGMTLSPCFCLAFGMPRGTMLISHTSPPRAGLPPTFCFISSPSSPSPFSFLTLFFLTDKRILNEPKSHRKCSFHGHFFFFWFCLFLWFCSVVIHGRGSLAAGWEDGTTKKAHSKTPVGSSGLSVLGCEGCSQLHEPELHKPNVSGTLGAQVRFARAVARCPPKA